jgi:hypothetical protein
MQQHRGITDQERMIWMMGGHQDRKPITRRKGTNLTQYKRLIAEIEARGRLIQHKALRLLRQGARDQHKLPFSAGKLCDGTISKAGDAKPFECFFRNPHILRTRRGKQGQARGAPHGDNIACRIGKATRCCLRHIGQAARNIAPRKYRQGLIAKPDLASQRRQQSKQGAKQRCLATAIRAEQTQHLAGFKREGNISSDDALTITNR